MARLHIPTALFAKAAGDLKMRHLPTNGGGPAVTAVLGSNVRFLHVADLDRLVAYQGRQGARAGRSSAKRVKPLPDVPTFKELGYDLEYYFWVGIFAPKGTPAPVVTKLREALNKAAHSQQFLDTIENLGQELGLYGPAANLRNSGTWTPSARKTRWQSVACRDDSISPSLAVAGSRFSQPEDGINDFARRSRRGRLLRRLRPAGVRAVSGDLPTGSCRCRAPASCRKSSPC